VVPDQHAAFGIQQATQSKRESAWKDLGLEELIRKAPGGEGGGSGMAWTDGTAGGSRRGMGLGGMAVRKREGLAGQGSSLPR
jgi:hypothetical protein